ncbi:hypothetical protein DEU56DRAFT_939104 [Suillus clintonianus]|uniref:uncharacterized protein n=1 Tax=Suillus clintonianus TaxID=1904413 RepID=UPI001B882F5C|nr:uncharacterized protein DEU56DRAFT_939104 [Suillus clintonianus]KAG2142962.1 hypothetical protein DEU56DRAFT_939104 [Suillus clintonianus]
MPKTPVQCPVCTKFISRKEDLPRHLKTHAANKEDLMHTCTHPGCKYKTLQKSNLQTHQRTHTRNRSQTCPEPGCQFSSTDPGSLTRHRKKLHKYEPKARHNPAGKDARRAAAAPYPSTRLATPEVDIHAPFDLNDLTFPWLAGLILRIDGSPAESSSSGTPQFSGGLTYFLHYRLFPHLLAGILAVRGQPD